MRFHGQLQSSVLALLLLAVPACRPNKAPVEAPHAQLGARPDGRAYTVEDVAGAVREGVRVRRWSVISESPGVLVARVDSGGHYAVVRITYDATGWTIARQETSPGLLFEEHPAHGPIIHHRYNLWIRNLDAAMRTALGAPGAGAGEATPTDPADPLAAPESAAPPQEGWDEVDDEPAAAPG